MDKDYVYDCETNSTTVYRNKYTGREVHIPKDKVTNGDMIMTMFPNASVTEIGGGSTIVVANDYKFNSTWWNAPYEW